MTPGWMDGQMYTHVYVHTPTHLPTLPAIRGSTSSVRFQSRLGFGADPQRNGWVPQGRPLWVPGGGGDTQGRLPGLREPAPGTGLF